MVLSKVEAFELLELPVVADQDSIRTSYKRLALKWHPEKHGNSADAVRRFKQVSNAYKRLQTDSQSDMTLDEMLRMFQEVFFSKSLGTLNGSGYDTSDDDDDDTDDSDDDIPYPLYSDKIRLKQDLKKKGRDNSRHLTAEEVNRNAEELITEEEKEKRKAEKRKAKKKRRRERKKLEKQDQKDEKPKREKSGEKGRRSDKKGHSGSSSEAEEAGFDPNSAFFTKVVNKKKKGQTTTETSQTGRKDKTKDKQQSGAKSEEEVEDLDPIVLRSRQLAIRGNEMAQLGHYNPAIELFTEAINLDPRDFRFFGNRSYCYDRIHQYEKALRDAEKAIVLAKDWAKGYFRKGRALAGLKLFPEAEKAFMQVLKLDKNCDDAVQELLRVRTYQLTEMGFSRQQAEASIKKHGSVQTALDSLLAGVAETSLSGEVYFSDEDEFITTSSSRLQPFQQSQPSDIKMDFNNPEGLTALWVGNVLPQVTEKKLVQMFQKYGTVTSVRLLPDKYCAFVNFKMPVSAGKAMQSLQGVECEGQRLLIKFPDNPICNGNGPAQTILKKNTASHTKTQQIQQQQQQQQHQQQQLQQQQQQQQTGFQWRRSSKATCKNLKA
ncbi:uncharacterized protein [Haliotis asinina]|uniref:uncharacterized protein isoform X2 n=1 Tax=Haliotis asinina TaxID=109174 RepID=UPI003531AB33